MSRRFQSREVEKFQFRWQPKQWLIRQAIRNARATHIGFGGSRGASKSHTGSQTILDLSFEFAEIKSLAIRRTYKEVYANCIGPMLQRWPVLRSWYRGPGSTGWPTIHLPNGSEIVFGYAENKLAIYDFQGDEFAFILVEEATHFNEEQLRFLDTVNRWTRNKDIIPKTLWTMNPGNVGHDFIKRVMVDGDFQENEDPKDYYFVQAFGWDNVEWCRNALREDGLTQKDYYSWAPKRQFDYFIKRSDYGRKLWALPKQDRDAHLFGDWDSFVGQFFGEFSRRIHVVKPFTIPSYWVRFCSFDWGFTSPACCLWHAISPEGRVYTYRELYVTGKDSAWLGRRCRELSGNEEIRYCAGDPSCWDATRGVSIAEVMAQNGWAMVQAENDRKNGWARCRQFLSYEQNEQGQLTREPGWQFFETCVNTIRTIPAVIHDEHDPEDIDTKGEDHAPDTWRYGAMTRTPATITPLDVMDYEYAEATLRAAHQERESRNNGSQFGPLD